MSDQKAKYEGMFLLDAGNPDFQAASEPVRAVLERHQVTALAIKPWDERRLAYEIRGRRRGLYVLSYFEADPLKVADIEHDCQLDERIIRVLVLRRDDLTEETIHADTPAGGAAKRAAERKAEEAEPAEKPAEKPVEQPAEQPVEQPAEKPAEGSDDQAQSDANAPGNEEGGDSDDKGDQDKKED